MHHFASPPPVARLGAFSGWLSLPQLITWGSVFYTFSLLVTPLEAELGMTRAQSSVAFSLALLAEGAGAWLVGRWIDRGREQVTLRRPDHALGRYLRRQQAPHDCAPVAEILRRLNEKHACAIFRLA